MACTTKAQALIIFTKKPARPSRRKCSECSDKHNGKANYEKDEWR